MAITIISSPDNYEYGYSPFYFQVSSTNYTQRSFKFIADVFVGYSSTSTYAGRFTFPVRPDNTGIFDPHQILNSYIETEFTPTASAMTPTYRSNVRYLVSFGEQYDSSLVASAATGSTSYSALSTTTTYDIINAYRYVEDFTPLSDRTYDVATSPTPKFLTNWNYQNPYFIRRSEWMTLDHFKFYTSSYRVKTFDSASTQIGEFIISNGWDANVSKYTIGVGTNNLDYSATNTITSGSTTIINSNVYYYTIGSYLSTALRSTEYGFQIIDDCPAYDLIRIAWLNEWGGYEYWTFNLKSRKSYGRKINEWERKLPFNYTKGMTGRRNLNVDGKRKLIVNSDLLTEDEVNYISTILFASEIYQVETDGSFVPLQLITDSLPLPSSQNDRLLTISLDFEYMYSVQSQRT